ncbi:MAG: hypothetical protein ACK5MK_06425 [Dysgonomonas sp.]
MKYKITFYLLMIIPIMSCSDVLTTQRAEQIISECLRKNPSYATYPIIIGPEIRLSAEEIAEYQPLINEGYLILEENPLKKYSYSLSLADKSKEFVDEIKEDGMLRALYSSETTYAILKICDYEVDKVNSVHEIPSTNTAEVKVTLKKVNKNPFHTLSKDKTDFAVENLIFTKTTDNKWILCD